MTFFALIQSAHAAELAPVSPPTDWFGVVVVVLVVLVVAVGLSGYVTFIRRMPGKQLGEDEIDAIAERLHLKQQTRPLVVHTESQEYDGKTFADVTSLEEYKAAKAIVDKYKS